MLHISQCWMCRILKNFQRAVGSVIGSFGINYELSCIVGVAGAASNREFELLLTVSFLNDVLGLEL